MGMTGSGKSSFISLCSDKQPEVGHDLESCTQTVNTYPFIYSGPPQKRVFLVDTPGFDDSTRSDVEVLRELAAWLTATYAKEIRLSGIIYLHRINQPRSKLFLEDILFPILSPILRIARAQKRSLCTLLLNHIVQK